MIKVIILPGFSLKNKDWAYEVKKNLPEFDIHVHEWLHWQTGNISNLDVENEIKRLNLSEEVNIIAKSIGTLVLVNLLKTNFVKKAIFNGIPMGDIESKDLHDYEVLADLDINRFLFIQNKDDNHGSHKNVSQFLQKINPDIEVISKPRDDHEYPYWDEFREFLK